MKRGAERQLTKDDLADDENGEETSGGMARASDTVLEGRKIAGLPKRRGLAAAASAPMPSPAPAPVASPAAPAASFGGFGGFSGFSTGSTTTGAPPPVFGGFGAPASASITATTAAPSVFSGFGKPITPAPAVETPVKFPGFGTGGTSSFEFKPSSTTAPLSAFSTAKATTSAPSFTMGDSTKPSGASSFIMSGMSKPACSTSPFTMSDSTKPSLASSASPGASIFADILSSSSTASIKPSPLTNGTSTKKPEEKPESATSDTELQYYRSLRGLNESLLSTIQKTMEKDCTDDLSAMLEKYKGFRAGIHKDFDASKSGSSASPGQSTSATAPTMPKPFSMPTPPTSFAFGGSQPATSPSTSTSAAPISGGFTPSLGTTAAAKSSGFTFPSSGPSSTSFFGAKPADATSNAPTSGATNLFGSSAALTPTSGTPLDLSNPFGSKSTFSWGAPAPAAAPAPAPAANAGAEGDGAAPGDGEATSLFPPAQHDLEGEGEEDEETTHSIKAKVFRMMKKTEDGVEKNYWADLGVGMLRLKKHKESPARRMLLRNSNTGKIIINFSLYDGLDPTLKDKTVGFVGRDEEGKPINFNIRVKTPDQAAQLKSAIDRDVELVKD